MQYRKFGNVDFNVSALGFGCMRLPRGEKNERSGTVDEQESIRMIRHAIDEGVNYVDTAYGYHDGFSEIVVGRALADGYREKVQLATKSPVWNIHAPEDFDTLLNEQLGKLMTDHIDFYLLHALDAGRWENTVLKYDVLSRAEKAIQDGKIGYLGFSFHDDYKAFETIVNGYDKWTFCQIQYNYLDTENQAGAMGLKLADLRGLAVVVMEPLLGGKLATPPSSIRWMLAEEDEARTPADWALQWIWNQPEVALVLSGMSDMTQVEQNLRSADRSAVNSFTPSDLKTIERAQSAYRSRHLIPCTKCGYCMPCNSGVDIPANLDVFNYAGLHEDVVGARNRYRWAIKSEQRSVNCTACGECEEKCPQKIAIHEWMPRINAVLSEGALI